MVYIRLEEIEKYAAENSIPIMQKDGIEFLVEYIKEHNIKKILEIGTAIGYSAIKMALVDEDITVTTIERDRERYDLALKNISSFSLQSGIFAKSFFILLYKFSIGHADICFSKQA